MSKPTVYLAGPVQHPEGGGHAWRANIDDIFDQFDWLNPLSKYDGPSENVHIVEDLCAVEERHDPGELLTSLHGHHRVEESGVIQEYVTVDQLVEEDKAMIDEADAVLVGWCRVPSVGTPMEILHAHEQGTPVVVWTRYDLDGEPLARERLSPWMLYHADRIVSSPIDAMRVLEEVADA